MILTFYNEGPHFFFNVIKILTDNEGEWKEVQYVFSFNTKIPLYLLQFWR